MAVNTLASSVLTATTADDEHTADENTVAASAADSADTADNSIYVTMMGDFYITYANCRITLERNATTKAIQLLQYLIYHGSEGATRERLSEILYAGEDDVINPHNNLKVNIFRLRKLLETSPLPACDYIVFRSGRYFWNSDSPVIIDAHEFEKAVGKIAEMRQEPHTVRMPLIKSALALYRGEFLPMLSAEPWVALEATRHKSFFLALAEEAINLYNSNAQYDESLALALRAVKLSPYEEKLHLLRIGALLDMRRYPEALAAYDEASNIFLEELGVSPSKEMRSIFHRITSTVRNSVSLVEEVLENLRRDTSSDGAYYCNYPSFIDCYLFTSRLAERNGQTVYLMLSTLTDIRGIPLDVKERISSASECLSSAIYSSLRRSDLFTRYSPCQYLSMLTEITRENCDLAALRVSESFRTRLSESGIRGVRVTHSFVSGLVAEAPAIEFKFSSNPWDDE